MNNKVIIALLIIGLSLMAAGTRCDGPVAVPAGAIQAHGTFPVPKATGEHPAPVWMNNVYWDQVPMGGFWQCPVGYVQVSAPDSAELVVETSSTMSPSLHGEISGGSMRPDIRPTCRLPLRGEYP